MCGGNKCDPKTKRSEFLKYLETNPVGVRMLLAEDAQKDLLSHDDGEIPYNIIEFEHLIANITDCILLFPESPGSYAELGYFSHSETISRKLLVAADMSKQGKDSFLMLGPFALVQQWSHFPSIIQMDYSNPTMGFQQVVDRVKSRFTSTNRKKFILPTYFETTFQQKFYLISAIFCIYRCLTLSDLEYAFKSLMGKAKREELKKITSILVSIGHLRRYTGNRELFIYRGSSPQFIEMDILVVDDIRLRLFDFYQKYYTEAYNALVEEEC